MNKQSRAFCFTVNNPQDKEESLKALFSLDYQYVIVGQEVGKQGTKHLQGFIILKSRLRHRTIIKRVEGVHFEIKRGSDHEAIEYCKKDGVFTEYGKYKESEQGKRNDMIKLKEMTNNTNRMDKVIEECQNFQQIRFVEKLYEYKKVEREKPKVIWIYGEPGSGKSKYCNEKTKGKNVYWKPNSSHWWNGYGGHKIVIFDDIDVNIYGFKNLLRLLDRYPLKCEIKGGFVNMCMKYIFLTTCEHPQELFSSEIAYQQVRRRIDKLLCMCKK